MLRSLLAPFHLYSQEKTNSGSNEDIGKGHGAMCVPLAFITASVAGSRCPATPSCRPEATHWCLSLVFLLSFLYQSSLRVQPVDVRKTFLPERQEESEHDQLLRLQRSHRLLL